MSVRERTAWIAIGATLVVWGYYFVSFGVDVVTRELDGSALLVRFLICIAVAFVVMIGLAAITGTFSRKNIDAPPDELERMIEGHADRIGFRFLETVIPIVLIGGLLANGWIAESFPSDPAGSTAVILTNVVLLVIVLTELVREAVHIIGFRMTA